MKSIFALKKILDYLRSLGVDLPDNSYTMAKLRNKIQPYKRNNDVFGSREALADALMGSLILDDLVNDLLSNCIIKNEYFLKIMVKGGNIQFIVLILMK